MVGGQGFFGVLVVLLIKSPGVLQDLFKYCQSIISLTLVAYARVLERLGETVCSFVT